MGAYSPSTGQYFNDKVTSLNILDDVPTNSIGTNQWNGFVVLYRPNDGGSGKDRIYFIRSNTSGLSSSDASATYTWNVKFLNSGRFTRMSTIYLAPNSTQTFDGVLVTNNGNNIDAEFGSSAGDYNYNVPAGTNPPNTYQDSFLWKQNNSIWNEFEVFWTMLYAGDTFCVDVTDIDCNTILKIELLNGDENNLYKQPLLLGNSSFNNWYLPKSNDSGYPSEDNGNGYHAFILLHLKTKQAIVNDPTSFGIEDIPSDIIFYDENVCPLNNSYYYMSTNCIPISANMQNTPLSGDTYLSGVALNYWNKDIAIAKIGVRIPKEQAFTTSGNIVWVGYMKE